MTDSPATSSLEQNDYGAATSAAGWDFQSKQQWSRFAIAEILCIIFMLIGTPMFSAETAQYWYGFLAIAVPILSVIYLLKWKKIEQKFFMTGLLSVGFMWIGVPMLFEEKAWYLYGLIGIIIPILSIIDLVTWSKRRQKLLEQNIILTGRKLSLSLLAVSALIMLLIAWLVWSVATGIK